MPTIRNLLTFVISACVISTSHAAVVVSVDLDRDAAGIQSSFAAIAGQEIRGAIVLQVIGPEIPAAITGYDFSLRFRTDELDLGSTFTFIDRDANNNIVVLQQAGNPTPPPLIGGGNMTALTTPINRVILENEGVQFNFTDDSNGPANPGAAGIFRDIDAGAIDGIATGGGTVASIYQFNLVAVNPMGTADVLDVVPVILQGTAFLDINNNPVQRSDITLIGASITATAVPEPSMLAFLGMGTLYVVRRRFKKTAEQDTPAECEC